MGTVEEFHRLYYDTQPRITFLGVNTLKCPLDLWVYQEILWERRPRLILEMGTARGGSALWLATVLDVIGEGRVVTVDAHEREPRPRHPRVTYVKGRSTEVADQLPVEDRTMVILDADHSRDNVFAELNLYGPRVTPGQYLIVEDTNLNGNPVVSEFGPGPHEAVEEFLRDHPEFTRDRAREKFLLTYHPGGYLLKS